MYLYLAILKKKYLLLMYLKVLSMTILMLLNFCEKIVEILTVRIRKHQFIQFQMFSFKLQKILIFLDFFKKKNVCVMTLKELFDFVTDPTVNELNMDDYLEKSMELTSTRSEITETEKVDDEVNFLSILAI